MLVTVKWIDTLHNRISPPNPRWKRGKESLVREAIRELEWLINGGGRGGGVPNSEVLDYFFFFFFHRERNVAIFSVRNRKQNENNIPCHCSDTCFVTKGRQNPCISRSHYFDL